MCKPALAVILACALLSACASQQPAGAGAGKVPATHPLILGDSFSIDSRIMGEKRLVNVFVPTTYGEKIDAPMPVLYMPDGGLNEDFLHVAGLVQVLVSNGGMRPFILVGIPNTTRRRDMTGPTSNDEDRKFAPIVGGSATFRRFIRNELMPTVRLRYRTTDEAAIVGESLAGLFIVETFFLEPDLFDTYIAIDPSLWWNNAELVTNAGSRLKATTERHKSVFLVCSNEPGIAKPTSQLAAAFVHADNRGVTCTFAPMPQESHATIYHPAAILAFRSVFAPPAP